MSDQTITEEGHDKAGLERSQRAPLPGVTEFFRQRQPTGLRQQRTAEEDAAACAKEKGS